MIPLTVFTGFLGSGKTTLIGHLVTRPAFARTAVIINEFGEIGLDHELVAHSEDTYVALASGCLCCKSRSDLAETLSDLLARSAAGALPPFDRIVIETSGLAEPAPILQTLITDTGLAKRITLQAVVTTVDAVNGLSVLAREPTSARQVALADRLIITKSDLAEGAGASLRTKLAAINPAAAILQAEHGRIDPTVLLEAAAREHVSPARGIEDWLRHAAQNGPRGGHDEITSFALVRDAPIHAVTLTLFLEALAEHCGENLLRLKGIVNIAESPQRPAVIHGVQHVFHPPEWLAGWPSEDQRTRMVFIGRKLPVAWIHALLEALQAEVVDAAEPRDRGDRKSLDTA